MRALRRRSGKPTRPSCNWSPFAQASWLSTTVVDGVRVELCGGSPPNCGARENLMARKVIGPTGSRRRRWLTLVCLAFTALVAVALIPSALADNVKAQTFELDANIAQDGTTTYDWANF